MEIETKHGNQITITDDGMVAIHNGTKYQIKDVDPCFAQIKAQNPQGQTAYIELDDADDAWTIKYMQRGEVYKPDTRSQVGLAEYHARESYYDDVMNEGYEGHNPYRDH